MIIIVVNCFPSIEWNLCYARLPYVQIYSGVYLIKLLTILILIDNVS
jgi:hypothetical protein